MLFQLAGYLEDTVLQKSGKRRVPAYIVKIVEIRAGLAGVSNLITRFITALTKSRAYRCTVRNLSTA